MEGGPGPARSINPTDVDTLPALPLQQRPKLRVPELHIALAVSADQGAIWQEQQVPHAELLPPRPVPCGRAGQGRAGISMTTRHLCGGPCWMLNPCS